MMIMNRFCLTLLVLLMVSTLSAQVALVKQGTATQLQVEGNPFIVLGGELGNSSASSVADIERIFPKLQRMGLNTVLVPAYWDMIEPEEGQFDYSLTDMVIRQARENDLKVIFLWFGAWKNSMSCYAPLWLKRDYLKYPRAYTRSGKPLEIVSAFSENVLQADKRAFSQWMRHIASVDKKENTVIMVQIENEIGMLEDARDYSPIANALFDAAVPDDLSSYLQKYKYTLHPHMLEQWERHGAKTQGTWTELFGSGLFTDEFFMAWHYAQYVEQLAKEARAVHPIPLFVNAAMNSRNRQPGEYPSAGPLAHLIDIWQCAAPSIDLLAPDLYDKGFTDWVARYHLPNNPLFIPEIRLSDDNAVQAFYILGEHDALGISPFSIEDGSDIVGSPLVQGYALLKNMMPLIAEKQGRGVMRGVYFEGDSLERVIEQNGVRLICRHNFTLPWDPRARNGSEWPAGGALVIELAPLEYIIAGSGVVVEFDKPNASTNMQREQLGEDGFAQTGGMKQSHEGWRGGSRIGIGTVAEVRFTPEGAMRVVRHLNGDQTHQGRHVRISVGEFSALHVKLYEYK